MPEQELSVQGIVDLASAFYGSAVLFSALENDVFTQIKKLGASATLQNLAEATNSDPRGLRLLLDACVAIGILTKSATVYQNTLSGNMALVSGSKMDLSHAILYNRDVFPAWGKLSHLVQSGKPVEAPEMHLGEDPERTRRFVLSMRGRAMAIGQSVIPMLDLTGCRTLLDLAGGPGTYAVLMAQANPEIHCTTVDLPAVSAVAAECVAESGMTDRVTCLAGDYHTDTYPTNAYDVVTIFGALHQESPDSILDILRRAHHTLKPNGKLFILDMMTDASHTHPPFSALFAVNMALTTHNGWVFSDSELKDWMSQTGFTSGKTCKMPPPMPHWLVVATKG